MKVMLAREPFDGAVERDGLRVSSYFEGPPEMYTGLMDISGTLSLVGVNVRSCPILRLYVGILAAFDSKRVYLV